jgi:hypothetical protein
MLLLSSLGLRRPPERRGGPRSPTEADGKSPWEEGAANGAGRGRRAYSEPMNGRTKSGRTRMGTLWSISLVLSAVALGVGPKSQPGPAVGAEGGFEEGFAPSGPLYYKREITSAPSAKACSTARTSVEEGR